MSVGSRAASRRRGGSAVWLGRCVLVMAGIMLALACLDLAFRLIRPVQAEQLLPLGYHRDDLRRIADGEAYLQFDQELGWTLRPGVALPAGPVVYQSNSVGLRALREYTPEPAPGVRRIAAFGDSFTHCDEVDNPDCWTERLEAAWPGSEILNYGVSGYAPDQAWLRYQREGNDFRPCAVLIGFMPENVNRVVNRFRPFYQPDTGIVLSKPRYLLDGDGPKGNGPNGDGPKADGLKGDGPKSDGLALLPNPVRTPNDLADPAWVERELGPHDYWYYPGLFASTPLDAFYPVRLARTSAYRLRAKDPAFAANDEAGLRWAYETGGEAYEVTSRILLGFARQVERDGRTPVVVIFGRTNDVIAKRHGEDRIYEPLVERLGEAGIATVDVTDALAREARRRSVDDLIDKHYRPRGNQTAAEALAQKLPALTRPTCG